MLRHFRRVRRHHRKLWKGHVAEIQQLERRSLLTGTVLVTFASNAVTIIGDNKGNEISVDVAASGAITVTGQNDTKVKFQSVIHDADDPVELPTPTAAVGITVNLKGGDDILAVAVEGGLGTLPLKNLTVDTGDEDDDVSVSVDADTTLNFADIVSISTGEGHDHLELNIDGTVTIAKALTINTGADDDEATVTINGTLTAKAASSFLTGDGEDGLTLQGEGGVTFENTLALNTGEDEDGLTVNLSQGLTVKGAATVTTGDGDDTVSIQHIESTLDFQKGFIIDVGTGNDHAEIVGESGTLHSGGELKVLAGSGNDLVAINEKLRLDAAFTITTGDGEDEVIIETGVGFTPPLADTEAPVANIIKGKTTIDTGDDADSVSVTVIAGTSLAVNAAAAISTGRGDDDVTLSNSESSVSFAAGLTIDTGATAASSSGADEVFLSGDKLSVTGALKIATGALRDTVILNEALSVTGNVGIDTGSGNDGVSLTLLAGSTPPATGAENKLGSLTINSGSGSDDVTVGNQEGGTAQINGIASIVTGTGLDIVELFADADLTIVKDLKFDTGAGDDHLLVQAILGSIRVNGIESVILGDDDDCFIQGTSTAIDPFRAEDSSSLGGGNPDATFQIDTKVTVLGGTGDDLIGFAGVQVGKDKPTPTAAFPASVTTLDSGAGDDVIGASDAIFRDLKVLAGEGNDIVAGLAVEIRGTTNIDLGGGDDQLAIDGVTTLNDNVTLAGGAGDDEFAVGADVTLTTGKKVGLNGGTGTDTVANASSIPDAAFNPLPAGIENLDGEIDVQSIEDAVTSLFQGCLSVFEEPID